MRNSADYVFRRTSGVHRDPRHRGEVDDAIFGPLMNLQAGHQKFLDIARLSLVSSYNFSKLSLCRNVQFLDVSYNRIEGEHIALIGDNCQYLRSLVLAGCKFTQSARDYEPLHKLTHIELLSLRDCDNLASVAFCRDLLMLRSLDLGQTMVESIEPLTKLRRIEELCLDLCPRIPATNESISALSQLTSLRLLNVQGSALENYSREDGMVLLDALHEDACVESKTRRQMFLEALVENNEPALQLLIGSGQDANIRVGAWAEDYMSELWRTRCRTPKLQTPFFMLSHEDSEMLPTPLHIAIMFNAQDAVAVLRLVNADAKKSCWFSDVEDKNFRLTVDEVKSSQQRQHVFTADELVDAMFDRNVHRLTEGMVVKKVTDWKKRCHDAREDLKTIMRHDYPQILAKRRVAAEKQAAIDKANMEKRMAHEAAVQASLDAKAADEKRARDLQARKDAIAMGQIEEDEPAEPKKGKQKAASTIAWAEEKTEAPPKSAAENEAPAVDPDWYGPNDDADDGPAETAELSRPGTSNDDAGISVRSAQFLSTAELEAKLLGGGGDSGPEPSHEEPPPQGPDGRRDGQEKGGGGVVEGEEEGGEPESAAPVYKKASRKPLTMLPKRPEHFPWRQHGMVSKLLDAPTLHKSTKSRRDVPVMGKRSYWLESAGHQLALRLQREDKASAEFAHRVKHDPQTANDWARQKMQRGLKDYNPKEPVPERKAEFLGLVDSRTQRKYVVRDDISDDGEDKKGESDDDKSI